MYIYLLVNPFKKIIRPLKRNNKYLIDLQNVLYWLISTNIVLNNLSNSFSEIFIRVHRLCLLSLIGLSNISPSCIKKRKYLEKKIFFFLFFFKRAIGKFN